jgi:Rieske Fe-S protein
MPTQLRDVDRRSLLKAFVNTVVVTLGGGLAGLLGSFAVPRSGQARERWVKAARLDQLTPNIPFAAVVSVPRDQGWYRERGQDVVFLTSDGKGGVRALSATCTHLGCHVRWDTGSKRFQCPCHGGAYDAQGAVVAGPPPRGLAMLDARVQDPDGSVMVRL